MNYRSHRGGCFYTPENTMAAFRDAILNQGFNFIETDPAYTKDGVIVLLHDNAINRTCRNKDGSEIERELLLSELTYDELMQFDAGIFMGEEFRGEKVPRLEELLEFTEGKGITLCLDKKIPTDNMDPLFDICEKYNSKIYFSCEEETRIKTVQKRFPNALINYDGPATADDLTRITKLVNPENMHIWMYLDKPNFYWLDPTRKASKEKVAIARRFAKVGIGNVNNACDVREAILLEPDFVEV